MTDHLICTTHHLTLTEAACARYWSVAHQGCADCDVGAGHAGRLGVHRVAEPCAWPGCSVLVGPRPGVYRSRKKRYCLVHDTWPMRQALIQAGR